MPKSLLHNLGGFFGGIWYGIKTDPAKPLRREVKRETEQETRDTPKGRVTIRRTIIEEVEMPPPGVKPEPDQSRQAPPQR